MYTRDGGARDQHQIFCVSQPRGKESSCFATPIKVSLDRGHRDLDWTVDFLCSYQLAPEESTVMANGDEQFPVLPFVM